MTWQDTTTQAPGMPTYEPNYVPSRLPPPGIPCLMEISEGLFQEKINEVAETTQAPWPLVVQGMLATSSLLFQGLMDVQKPNGQIVPSSIYTIGIADSGERKSTIANAYTRPIYRFLEEHTGENASEALQHYQQDEDIWQATRRRLVQAISKAKTDETVNKDTRDQRLNQLRQQLDDHEAERPSKPTMLGLNLFSDVTPAGLHRAIRDQQLSSVGLFTAEGEELVENGFQNRLSALNAPWSDEPAKIERATTGSSDLHFRLTIYLQLQPGVAQDFFHKRNCKARNIGLAARSLLTYPPSRQGLRSICYLPESSDVDLNYQERVCEILERNVEALQDRDFQRSVLTFSPQAQEWWFIISDEIERASIWNGRFQGFGDHAAKLSDNIVRVAALIHAFDHDLDGEISYQTLERAIYLCFFFSDEFLRIFTEPDQEKLDAARLESYLLRKANTDRYLRKAFVKSHGPVRPSSRADIAIGELMQQGKIGPWLVHRVNQYGKPVKPVELIDLYPQMPPNDWEMQRVANLY